MELIDVSGERIGIEIIVGAALWIIAIPLAFYFVGPAVGIIVIVGGLALFAWWLATVIRSSTVPADEVPREPDRP